MALQNILHRPRQTPSRPISNTNGILNRYRRWTLWSRQDIRGARWGSRLPPTTVFIRTSSGTFSLREWATIERVPRCRESAFELADRHKASTPVSTTLWHFNTVRIHSIDIRYVGRGESPAASSSSPVSVRSLRSTGAISTDSKNATAKGWRRLRPVADRGARERRRDRRARLQVPAEPSLGHRLADLWSERGSERVALESERRKDRLRQKVLHVEHAI